MSTPEAEQESLVFRRSIYAAADIPVGDGAPPHLYQQLLGRPARRAYSRGTPVSLDQLL